MINYEGTSTTTDLRVFIVIPKENSQYRMDLMQSYLSKTTSPFKDIMWPGGPKCFQWFPITEEVIKAWDLEENDLNKMGYIFHVESNTMYKDWDDTYLSITQLAEFARFIEDIDRSGVDIYMIPA